MISSHAAQGISSNVTFSVIVNIAGKRGLALVDSGSTDTFMDYTFASKRSCPIISTASKQLKVAAGGFLDSIAFIHSTVYQIQNITFCNAFTLLELKGYEIIIGCGWIKQHNPIGLDLRPDSRQLTIHKDGKATMVFHDFTTSKHPSLIHTVQMEKLYRNVILGYVVHVNFIQ
jgi:hypothetical protein